MAEYGQIEVIDEDVDDANWIIRVDPVLHAFRKWALFDHLVGANE